MFQKFLICVAVFLLSLLGVAPTPAFAAGTAAVSGTVTSGSNSIPSTDVSVYPVGTRSGAVAETSTATDGTYSLSVPLGTWDFVFTPPSPFNPVTRSAIAISADHSLDVDVVQAGVSFVSGRILDDRGTPVAGVNFAISNSADNFGATTGPDGRFSLAARNGSYILSLGGFGTDGVDVPRDYWTLRTAPDAFIVGGDLNLGDVELPAPVHLSVTVLDPEGQPLPDAGVTVLDNVRFVSGSRSVLGLPIVEGFQGTPAASTDSTGSGTLVLWPAEPARLRVSAPPLALELPETVTAFLDLSSDQQQTIRVDASIVSGRLVDDLGAPVAGLGIEFSNSTGGFTATARSDGTFKLAVKDGTYAVTVSSGAPTGADVPGGYWRLDTGTTFVVNGNADLGDVALPAPVRLDLTVVDTDERAVADARVTTAQASVSPSGFLLFGVPVVSGLEGGLSALTDATGMAPLHMWPTSSATFSVTPSAGSLLLSDDGASVDVSTDTAQTIHLFAAALITGRVVDDRGTPIAGLSIDIGGPFVDYSATTGPDGRFSIAARTGSYALSLHGSGASGLDVPNSNWRLTTAAGAFAVDGDRDLGDVTLPRPVTLTAHVVDPTDQAVSVGWVYVFMPPESILPGFASLLGMAITGGAQDNQYTSTDSAGVARFTVWPSQPVALQATPPIGNTTLLETSAQSVDVSSDATVTLHLDTVAVVSGRLVDDQKAPIAEDVITLESVTGGIYTAVTAPDGSFSIAVRRGQYSLSLGGSNNPLDGASNDLPKGFWTVVSGAFAVDGDRDLGDVVLPAPAHLTVTVLDPGGQAVANAEVTIPDRRFVPAADTVVGIPVALESESQWAEMTDSAGTSPPLAVWRTGSEDISVIPPAGTRMLPTTIPSLDLSADTEVVLAYQSDGSTVVITGAADAYTTFEGDSLDIAAPASWRTTTYPPARTRR